MVRSFLRLCLGTSLWALSSSGALAAPDLARLVAEGAGISARELESLGDGFIARELPIEDRSRGLALIGVMRLAATSAQLHAAWGRVDEALAAVEDVSVKALNVVSKPVRDDEFHSYELSKVEKKALEACRPRKCRLKLPSDLIGQLQRMDYSWQRDADAFTTSYRSHLADMVRGYRSRGDQALWVYADKSKPMHAADGFGAALAQAGEALTAIPEITRYLLEYPEAAINHDIEEFMFWSVLDFGQRPTLTINHAVSAHPEDLGLDYLVAIKTIYANHYFNGRASFGALFRDGLLGAPGTYFVLVDHMSFDGKLNRLMRSYVSSGIVADVENKLRFIRAAVGEGEPPLISGKKKGPVLVHEAFLLKPDDDLLSHGETPHYHRRCVVSLLSSTWDQVVPTRYCRQTNRFTHFRARKLFNKFKD